MLDDEFVDALRELIDEAREKMADGRIAELMDEEARSLRDEA